MRTRPLYAEIFLVAFGVILLEISYTRDLLVQALLLLHVPDRRHRVARMGSGGVFTAISPRFRRVGLDRIIPGACMARGSSVFIGYFAIALIQLNSTGLPSDLRRGSQAARHHASASSCRFSSAGVVIASVFAEDPGRIHRLYFADLLGAGVACALVVPLIGWLTPPGLRVLERPGFRRSPVCRSPGAIFAAASRSAFRSPLALLVGILQPDPAARARPGRLKTMSPQRGGRRQVSLLSVESGLSHRRDGIAGSDACASSTTTASSARPCSSSTATSRRSPRKFERDSRSYPFALAKRDPKVLIIGAAGGHEVLASLYFGAAHVTGVELNPATYSLLTTHFADYTGHIAKPREGDAGERRGPLVPQARRRASTTSSGSSRPTAMPP